MLHPREVAVPLCTVNAQARTPISQKAHPPIRGTARAANPPGDSEATQHMSHDDDGAFQEKDPFPGKPPVPCAILCPWANVVQTRHSLIYSHSMFARRPPASSASGRALPETNRLGGDGCGKDPLITCLNKEATRDPQRRYLISSLYLSPEVGA